MTFEEQYVANRAKLWQTIVMRATQDEEFRSGLLNDPKTTLEQEFSVSIPERAEIRVLEETPETQYVVLPPKVAMGQGELSEEELEAVAGGWHVTLLWSGICFGSGDSPACDSPDVNVSII